MSPKGKELLRCSSCGKPQDEALRLTPGPSIRICDGCLRVRDEILADEVPADASGVTRRSFDRGAGNFTRPKCQTGFVLHSRHVEPQGRRP